MTPPGNDAILSRPGYLKPEYGGDMAMEENYKGRESFFHVDLLKEGTELSATQFNMGIGLLLLFGFGMNILCLRGFASAVYSLNPVVLLVLYFVCVLAGTVIANSSKNPVMCFIGYCLVAIPMGICISPLVRAYTTGSVLNAMMITAAITTLMMFASMARPQWFAGLGKTLFVSLIIVFIVELVSVFLLRTHLSILDYIVAAIFSLYIGYDWHVANLQFKSPVNTVRVALNLYLDIINLFVRLLQIFGKRRSDSF